MIAACWSVPPASRLWSPHRGAVRCRRGSGTGRCCAGRNAAACGPNEDLEEP